MRIVVLMYKALSWITLCLGISGVVACSDSENAEGLDLFADDVRTISIEIDYQQGAQPYDESPILNGANPFTLLRTNIHELFSESPAELIIPDSIDDMEQLNDISTSRFTRTEILDIAEQHRDLTSTHEAPSFYVIFLDGTYQEADRNAEILGVSFEGRRLIAIFKPVIKTEENPEIVEQINLIHEIGHAIGLVDAGIPMVDNHLDTSRNAGDHHCDNPNCIMYYGYESGRAEDIVDDLRRGDSVLFDQACLADVRNVSN